MNMLNTTAIIGGTFDPIHYGHLNSISSLATTLNLSKIYLLPANTPPHKSAPLATAKQRLDMLKLAIEDLPLFAIDYTELNKNGSSYTIDTLKNWRQHHANDESLLFIIGEDLLATLDKWHNWQQLINYCHLIVCPRPDVTEITCSQQLQHWIDAHLIQDKSLLKTTSHGHVFLANTPLSPISASKIRQRLANGDKCDNVLPRAVLNYIKQHKLYQVHRETPSVRSGI